MQTATNIEPASHNRPPREHRLDADIADAVPRAAKRYVRPSVDSYITNVDHLAVGTAAGRLPSVLDNLFANFVVHRQRE
jgi:hypothetical protein